MYEKMLNVTVREMQIKATMKYHVIPVRMAIINKSTNKCWQKCGGKGTFVHSVEMQTDAATVENTIAFPQKIKNVIAL